MMKASLIFTIGVELSLCTVPWASVGWELIMFAAVLSFQLHGFNYAAYMQAVHTPNSFLWMNWREPDFFCYSKRFYDKVHCLAWLFFFKSLFAYLLVCFLLGPVCVSMYVCIDTFCASEGAWFSRTTGVLVQKWESCDCWWPILHGAECTWNL